MFTSGFYLELPLVHPHCADLGADSGHLLKIAFQGVYPG